MPTKMVPPKRPQQTREETMKLIRQSGAKDKLALVGIRGYYRDTMGVPGKNDRGVYDDAILVVGPECYVTFNANTDPSVFRKTVATLQPGVWRYKKGKHPLTSRRGKNNYDALRQAAPVTVLRDADPPAHTAPWSDNGWFGINIHKGGFSTTGSEGCQTIFPDQWLAFQTLVYSEMDRNGQSTVPYILVANNED